MVKAEKQTALVSDDVRRRNEARDLARAEFAKRLKSAMLARHMSQSELSRQSGVKRDSISTYVNAKTLPGMAPLKKIAAALDVTPEELLIDSLQRAIEDDNPSIEIRAAAGQPDMAWLRINRAVPFNVAAKIIAIINEADEAERNRK